MKKIAVAALSLMLACSLCPVASFASDAVLQDELAVSDSSESFASDIPDDGGLIEVNGDEVLSEDVTVKKLCGMIVAEGARLTIPAGVTLTNEWTLQNYGTIVNNGTIFNNGFFPTGIDNLGTIVNNGALVNNGSLKGAGGITGTGSFSGNKGTQTRPNSPTVESVGGNSVTLAPAQTTGQGATEYGYDEGSGPGSWQTLPVFTDLKPSTRYIFYTRYAGAVSYTHLDVYKRQIPSAPSPRRRGCATRRWARAS